MSAVKNKGNAPQKDSRKVIIFKQTILYVMHCFIMIKFTFVK